MAIVAVVSGMSWQIYSLDQRVKHEEAGREAVATELAALSEAKIQTERAKVKVETELAQLRATLAAAEAKIRTVENNAGSEKVENTEPNFAAPPLKESERNSEAGQTVVAPPPTIPAAVSAAPAPLSIPAQSEAPPEKPDLSPASTVERGIQLYSTWKTPLGHSFGGGSRTMADLREALQFHGEPSDFTGPAPEVTVFQSIKYLTPIGQTEASLHLKRKERSAVKIGCPGFPEGLAYYSYDAELEPGYKRTYIVVDRADQVCAVQLVDETPKAHGSYYGGDSHKPYITYNFVNYRTKVKRDLSVVYHVEGVPIGSKVVTLTGVAAWRPRTARSGGGGSDSICLNSELIDQSKVLERVKLYTPRPVVNLILYCIQGRRLPQ